MAPLYDAVFVQWILLPEETLVALRRCNIPIIFDFDDAVFLRNGEAAEKMIKSAQVVLAGSHLNYDYAKALNAGTMLMPSSVPLNLYNISGGTYNRDDTKRAFCIGWIGSISTVKYLDLLVAPLQQIVRQGYHIELLLAGTDGEAEIIAQFEGIPLTIVPRYSAKEIPELVQRIDIGVMPLHDNDWERAKCALKALLYMAGAKPAVCSAVGEILHIVRDGENGLLAASAADWERNLKTLMDNQGMRHEIGLHGRATVEQQYSTALCFDRMYKEVFLKVGRGISSFQRGQHSD